MASRLYTIAAALTALAALIPSTLSAGPETAPHKYPGIPAEPLGPVWQKYYEVTAPLPNVTFSLSRSYAGNIPVGHVNHPEDTLYFWGFEKSDGSLAAAAGERADEPWGIWLNGGPGTSSLYGFHFENGPILINPDQSASPNEHSFEKLADFFWIDQPVGVGFSTSHATGYVADEDQVGVDFMGFLANLVKVFPSLATRPLHLTGESYAGVYIPYIMKAYFAMATPPVKIANIVMGNPSIASEATFIELSTVSVLETYPQLIGYDLEVLNYFKEQSKLCGYEVNATYPQQEAFPFIPLQVPDRLKEAYGVSKKMAALSKREFTADVAARYESHPDRSLHKRSKELKRRAWKRDNLDGRAKGKIDDWYGCLLLEEVMDYAVNFTFPWTLSQPSGGGFNVYNIPDALFPPKPENATLFLNDNRTRTALHAPDTEWTDSFAYPWNSTDGSMDPSPAPIIFMSDLATNLTAHNIGVVLYSGNDDALIAHHGTEITIQNITFGGVRGFTRKPSTPWSGSDGSFAGVIHQERGWTYALFKGASHLVPQTKPANMFTFMQQFVLGTNQTGLVTSSPSGVVAVNGGEDLTLANDIMPGQDEIYYGPGVTQSTYVFPQATIAAFRSVVGPATPKTTSKSTSGGHKVELSLVMCFLPMLFWVIS